MITDFISALVLRDGRLKQALKHLFWLINVKYCKKLWYFIYTNISKSKEGKCQPYILSMTILKPCATEYWFILNTKSI